MTSGGTSPGGGSGSESISAYPRITVSGTRMSWVTIERKSARSCSSACRSLTSRKMPIRARAPFAMMPSASSPRIGVSVTSHTPRGGSSPRVRTSPVHRPCSVTADNTVPSALSSPGTKTKSLSDRPGRVDSSCIHAWASAWFTKSMRPMGSRITTPSVVARSATASTSISARESSIPAEEQGVCLRPRITSRGGTCARAGNPRSIRHRIDAARG